MTDPIPLSGLLLVGAFVLSLFGTRYYRGVAIRRGFLANPNFRSLHQEPVPRGGGLVFAALFLVTVAVWGVVANPDPALMGALLVGGTFATLVGFTDDTRHLSARTKFAAQGLLAGWLIHSFGWRAPYDLPFLPPALDVAIAWAGLVWMMNLYNFMDGVDGMAASGAVFICVTAAAMLALAGAERSVPLMLLTLAACAAGFLQLNWPRARIFMGDAGSLFLGFCFGAFMMKTTTDGTLSIWTWLVMFGYFAGDTTTTTVLRILLTDKWYGEHRSHAYQNLARIGGSHLRVVRGVLLYKVLWLLPLAVASVLWPDYAPLAAVAALGPAIVLALRFGPRLSSS